MTLEMAIEEAEQLLADAAEGVIRMVLVGWTLGRAASLPAMNKKRDFGCDLCDQGPGYSRSLGRNAAQRGSKWHGRAGWDDEDCDD